MTDPTPVRTAAGPLHLAKPTGRAYRTACGRTLRGAGLVVAPRRLWAKVWALELVCKQCAAIGDRASTPDQLARLAGW